MSARSDAVLIVKLGALGDIMIATPVIRAIQRAEHGKTIWLFTTPAFAPIFAHWPGLQVKSYPRKGPLAVARALWWIRQRRFQRVYDLQGNDRSRMLCAISGIPERVGNARRCPYTRYPAETSFAHPHHRLNALLAAAGISPVEPRPWLPVIVEHTQRVASWLNTQGLRPRGFALLHAGGSARWQTKRWPYYAELAAALRERDCSVVWIGAGDDAALNRDLAAHGGIDATDRFSVCELAELGRRARFRDYQRLRANAHPRVFRDPGLCHLRTHELATQPCARPSRPRSYLEPRVQPLPFTHLSVPLRACVPARIGGAEGVSAIAIGQVDLAGSPRFLDQLHVEIGIGRYDDLGAIAGADFLVTRLGKPLRKHRVLGQLRESPCQSPRVSHRRQKAADAVVDQLACARSRGSHHGTPVRPGFEDGIPQGFVMGRSDHQIGDGIIPRRQAAYRLRFGAD